MLQVHRHWSLAHISRLLCLVVCITSWTGCRSTSGKNDSETGQEVDDRLTEHTKDLIDVSKIIEAYINSLVNSERKKLAASNPKYSGKSLAKAVYDSLGENKNRSGVRVKILMFEKEIAQLSRIESLLTVYLAKRPKQIAFIRYEDSRYNSNPIGIFSGKVWAHTTEVTADHSISPVIKIGETLIGMDKIGHIFQQGYWYYDANLNSNERWQMGLHLEGDPSVKDLTKKYGPIISKYCKSCGKFGYFGSYSTGVISYADCYANEYGFRFYRDLAKDPQKFEFKFSDHDMRYLNEIFNPNRFTKKVKANN